MPRENILLLDISTLFTVGPSPTDISKYILGLTDSLNNLVTRLRQQPEIDTQSIQIEFIIHSSMKKSSNIKIGDNTYYNKTSFLTSICRHFFPDFKSEKKLISYGPEGKLEHMLPRIFPESEYNVAILTTELVTENVPLIDPTSLDAATAAIANWLQASLEDSAMGDSVTGDDPELEDELIVVEGNYKCVHYDESLNTTHTIPPRGSSKYLYGCALFKRRYPELAYELEDIEKYTEIKPSCHECPF